MSYKDWWKSVGKKYWSLGDDKPATDDQQEIIYKICQAILKGRKNIILNLGVGFGKSAIAKTLCNMKESSYILTNNVALQKQYSNDFDDIALLMGRGKYPCHEWDKDCSHCYMAHIEYTEDIPEKLRYLNASPTWKFPENMSEWAWENYLENTIRKLKMWKCNDCPYTLAVREAMNTDCTVCNYHSLYFNSNVINRFGSRDLIVFDEGHYFEEILCQINTATLKSKSVLKKYGIDILEHNEGDNIYSRDYWIQIINQILFKIEDTKTEVLGDLQGIVSDADYMKTLKEFNEDIQYWEHMRDNIIKMKCACTIQEGHIVLEPVYGKPFTNELNDLGDIRIFMSGTFPRKNTLARWFGLKLSETEIITKYPDFPVENRPVICDYVGRVKGGPKHISSWKNDKMESKLIEIANNHVDENGVVHCTSNLQAEYICDVLDDEGFMTYPCYDGNYLDMTKQELIDEFIEDGGILVGGNIKEGLDLKGDICTFQVLFKVPYPAHPKGGRIDERMAFEQYHYTFHTASLIEQAYGRGIRSPTDKCSFYVLDACFKDLLKKNCFSDYFMEAIQ